jgi:hypothetical protein
MKPRWIWLCAYVLAIVMAVGGGAYYVRQRSTKVDAIGKPAQLAVGSLSVSMTVAGGQHELTQGNWLNIGVQIDVAAKANPVKSIELWDGARRFDVQAVDVHAGDGPLGGASFRWPTLVVGEHMLYARAVDSIGNDGVSTSYVVDVLTASTTFPGVTPTLSVPVAPGATTDDVAQRLGVPPGAVTLVGADGLASTPGAVAAHVAIVASATSGLDGDKVSVIAAAAAGAITLTAKPSGCGVALHSGVGSAQIAHAAPGHPSFVTAGSTNSKGDLTLANLVPGTHVVTARVGVKESSPVEFAVPQSCAKQAGWAGNVSLAGGFLTTAKPVTHGYAYVGVDDQPLTRIPADPTQFISTPGGRIDLNGKVPALAGHTMHLEVWQQDQLVATQIGVGNFNPLKGIDLTDYVGEPDVLTLSTSSKIAVPQDGGYTLSTDGPLDFGWTDTSARADKVMWQLLATPLPATNHEMHPAALITSGFNARDNCIFDCGGSFSFQTLDIRKLLSSNTPPGGGFFMMLAGLMPNVYLRVVGVTRATGPAPIAIPFASSASIKLTFPLQAAETSNFELSAVTVLLGAAPNFDLAECVDVSGTHWNSYPASQRPFESYFYPVDGRYCYSQFDHPSGACSSVLCWIGDAIDAVVDAIGAVWDVIASVFNGIISTVVNLIAKFNPVCLAMGAFKGGQQPCEAVAKIVARAAISAVLMAYGIPPSLPTSAQVGAIVQGDLGEIGVQLLKELGVPCDSLVLDSSASAGVVALGNEAGVAIPTASNGQLDACRVAVEAVINAVKKQVQASAQDSAAAYAGVPSCPIEECTMIPTPGGRTQPTVVVVAGKRTSGPTAPGQVAPVKVVLSATDPDLITNGIMAPVPFEGGVGYVTSRVDEQDYALGILVFNTHTYNYCKNCEVPGELVTAVVTPGGKGPTGATVTGTIRAGGAYGPRGK